MDSGSTSRLIANLPLFRANLCPLTFVDVPEAAYSRAILGVHEAQAVAARVPEPDRAAVLSITVDELRRLHEGVLARYGLRPSEFAAWKARAAD